MEEKKSNKGLFWLNIILIVFVVGLAGFIIYDKVLSETNEEPNVEENNEKNEVEVVEAANFVSQYYGDNTISFILPKIINGGENAEKLNKVILDTVLSANILPNGSNETTGYPERINVNYSHKKIDNVLIIYATSSQKPHNGSGTGDYNYDFYYDMKNDQIIDVFEAFKIMGLNDSDIINIVGDCNWSRHCEPNPDDYEPETCTIDTIKTMVNSGFLRFNIIDKNNIDTEWSCI